MRIDRDFVELELGHKDWKKNRTCVYKLSSSCLSKVRGWIWHFWKFGPVDMWPGVRKLFSFLWCSRCSKFDFGPKCDVWKVRCSDIQCSECSKFSILVFVPRLKSTSNWLKKWFLINQNVFGNIFFTNAQQWEVKFRSSVKLTKKNQKCFCFRSLSIPGS